jgi:PAS domain-containing protein
MRPFSLEGKLTLLMAIAAAIAAALTAGLSAWLQVTWLGSLYALLLTLPARPGWLASVFTCAADACAARWSAVSSACVTATSASQAEAARRVRRPGARAQRTGRVLRDERQNLFQRELLLDAMVQNSPIALILIETGDHVVYANLAARALLNDGRAMNGFDFKRIVAECPPALRQALDSRGDGLFSAAIEQEEETFHLSQRTFRLYGREHRMYLIKRLTRELGRQEVKTWKKVIRVISHELNNSLAPILLAHSGRELRARVTAAPRCDLDTIEERVATCMASPAMRNSRACHSRGLRNSVERFSRTAARHFSSCAPAPAQLAVDRVQLEQVDQPAEECARVGRAVGGRDRGRFRAATSASRCATAAPA